MANEYKLSYTAQEIDERLNKAGSPDWNDMVNKPFGEISSNKIIVFDNEVLFDKDKYTYYNVEDIYLDQGILVSEQVKYNVTINGTKYEDVGFKSFIPYSDFRGLAFGNLAVADMGYQGSSTSNKTDTGENWAFVLDEGGMLDFTFKDNSQLIDSKAHITIEMEMLSEISPLIFSTYYSEGFDVDLQIIDQNTKEFISDKIFLPGNNIPIEIKAGDNIIAKGMSHGIKETVMGESWVISYLGNIGLYPDYAAMASMFTQIVPTDEDFLIMWEVDTKDNLPILNLSGIFKDLPEGEYDFSIKFSNSSLQIQKIDNKYISFPVANSIESGNAMSDDGEPPIIAVGKNTLALGEEAIAIGGESASLRGLSLGSNIVSRRGVAIGRYAYADEGGIIINDYNGDEYYNADPYIDNYTNFERINSYTLKISNINFDIHEYQKYCFFIPLEYISEEGKAQYSMFAKGANEIPFVIECQEILSAPGDYSSVGLFEFDDLYITDEDWILDSGEGILSENYADEKGIVLGHGYADKHSVSLNGSCLDRNSVAINGIAHEENSIAINGEAGNIHYSTYNTNGGHCVAIDGLAGGYGSMALKGTSFAKWSSVIDATLLDGDYSRAWGDRTLILTSGSGGNITVEYANQPFDLNSITWTESMDVNNIYYLYRGNSQQVTIYKSTSNTDIIDLSGYSSSDFTQVGTATFSGDTTILPTYSYKAAKIEYDGSVYSARLYSKNDIYTLNSFVENSLIEGISYCIAYKKDNEYNYSDASNVKFFLEKYPKGGISHLEIETVENKNGFSFKFINDKQLILPQSYGTGYRFALHLNKSPVQYALLLGDYSVASKDNQTIMGKYNAPDKDALFILGNGIDNTQRSNAFTVKDNGDAEFSGTLKAKKIITDEGVIGGGSSSGSSNYAFLKDIEDGKDYAIYFKNGQLMVDLMPLEAKIVEMPNKTTYYQGEYFDDTGIVFDLINYDGTTKEATSATSKYDTNPFLQVGDIEFEVIPTTPASINPKITVTVQKFDPTVILQDFNYSVTEDGFYLITGWKGTVNGVASTEMIIPKNALIKF